MFKNEQIKAIREAFGEVLHLDIYDGFYNVVERLYDMNRSDQNPRFMRDRWLGYIAGENGKNGGKVKVAA